MNFKDRLNKQGGLNISHSNGETPCFGKIWFVDATNGSATGDGDNPSEALSTVQLAVTAQIAGTSGLGDVIYVMPGTYTETVTASAFTNVQLIGVTCGGAGDAVIMQSASGSALVVGADGAQATTMTNSGIRNITFLTSSAGTRNAPALVVAYMTKSVIDRCKFKGTYDAGKGAEIDTTCGLQIGNVTDTNYEFHEHSRISNNEFTTNGIREFELDTAIYIGSKLTATPANRGFKSMIIENNIISAEQYGIRMMTGASSCGGTIIRNNTINNHQGGGPFRGIVSNSLDGTDALCFVVDNRIVAINDGIHNFEIYNVHGNVVSIAGGNPAGELPAG